MTNRYETVFILTPVLSEDQTKETVTKFKDLVKKGRGKIRHEESWGMRKLAYPIQKKSSGFYHLIEFDGDPAFHIEFAEKRRDRRSGAADGAAEAGDKPARAPRRKKENVDNA